MTGLGGGGGSRDDGTCDHYMNPGKEAALSIMNTAKAVNQVISYKRTRKKCRQIRGVRSMADATKLGVECYAFLG